MSKQEQILPKKFSHFVWFFIKPYKRVAFLFVMIAFLAGFWGPINSVLTKYIINLLPDAMNNISILFLPGVLIVLNFLIFDNFTWRSIAFLIYKYEGVITNNIIRTTMDHVLSESHQFFQDNLSGRISSQITKLAENIELILFRSSMDFIRGGSTFIISLVASFYVNYVFTCVLTVFFILFTLFSVVMSKRLIKLADKHAAEETLVSGQLVDVISNNSNVRIFARKPFELLRIDKFLNRRLKAFRSEQGFLVIFNAVQGLMITAMMGFAVYFLIYFYRLNMVTVGDFALILGLSMELGHMVWYTMSRFDEFNQAYGKCKQSLDALMRYPEIQDKEDAKHMKCENGSIMFDQVRFKYRGSKMLFDNQSVEIKEGQKVGLVGYSGGGKSTFVNLILRLHDVTGGNIKIDGQDIRDVTQDSLRSAIAMIPQDPVLFHRSLLENIKYGSPDSTDEEVQNAAKRAHADDFIKLLPEGYDSLVGERGVKLSGGQRQRIAIARAILKDAPILILDEATSQLDSVTEGIIQETVMEMMKGRTTIVIAHRLSTLLHMDRILVFDEGKIIQDGSHSELVKKGDLYKTLWDSQIGGFLSDKP